MTGIKSVVVLTLTMLIVALSAAAVGQDKATPQEVVAKVREAASILSTTGDVAQFNQRHGPWVWKDTYVFVHNCDDKVIAAHPMEADLIGQDFMSLKDAKGNNLFVKNYCDQARKPSGIWSEYWWPKPGQTGSSRKLTYSVSAKGTPYVVVAGIYDEKATIDELSKLTSEK